MNRIRIRFSREELEYLIEGISLLLEGEETLIENDPPKEVEYWDYYSTLENLLSKLENRYNTH